MILSLKRFFTSPWGMVLLTFGCASVLAALIFPEFLIFHNIEFVLNSFWANYWGAFTFTSFFYHGGPQLWDPYSQLPLAYYSLTDGIAKFFNVWVALAYYLFSPFHTNQPQFFHDVYSVVFFLSNLFLKVAGSYLLFRKFSSSKWVAAFGAVYLAVIASAVPFISGGLSYGSYVPLLIFFTLNVFEYLRWKDILCWALLFCIICADQLQHATYLYQGLHFMVLSCIIWAFSRRKTVKLESYQRNRRRILLTGGLCVILILPVLLLLQNLMSDVYVGTNSGRLLQLGNWQSYFTRPLSLASSSLPHFLATLVAFTKLPFWICVGYGVVFFALFGVVVSRDPRRIVFLVPVIVLWMLNQPRNSLVGGLAHFVNFLTNPLNIGVRNFQELHMYFLPVWLMALAVIGIEAFKSNPPKKSVPTFVGIMTLFLAVTWGWLSTEVRVYCVIQYALSMSAVYFFFFKPQNKKYLPALFGAFLFIDCGVMIFYDRDISLQPYVPHAHVIEGRPDLGLVGIDAQNPKVLPYREHFSLSVYPETGNPYLSSWRVQGVSGMFYRYTNFGLNLMPALENQPRHRAYAAWDSDGSMKEYLSRDTHLIASGERAVKGKDGSLEIELLPAGKPQLQSSIFNVGNEPIPLLKDGLVYLQFPLQNYMPEHYASTFLTVDSEDLQFYATKDGAMRRLTAVQGQIVRPWTFDYNNIREGYLTAAFLPQDYPVGGQFALAKSAPAQEGVVKVWKWQYDNFGFDYNAPTDRWVLLHYPFDSKWQITVDGKVQPFSRANKSFIAFPVKAGLHHVLVQYWPHTPLRFLLLLSTIVAFFSLMVLIHLGLRENR